MPDIKEKLVELIVCPCESEAGEGVFACPSRKDGECAKVTRLPYCVTAKMADHLIANGVTIQKWISVKERLPEYGDKVLVCDTREDYVGIGVLQKGFEFMDEKDPDYWCWSDDCFNLDEFTHWMQLPEPPAEVVKQMKKAGYRVKEG